MKIISWIQSPSNFHSKHRHFLLKCITHITSPFYIRYGRLTTDSSACTLYCTSHLCHWAFTWKMRHFILTLNICWSAGVARLFWTADQKTRVCVCVPQLPNWVVHRFAARVTLAFVRVPRLAVLNQRSGQELLFCGVLSLPELLRPRRRLRKNCRHPEFGSGSGMRSRRRSALGVLFDPNTFNSWKTPVSSISSCQGMDTAPHENFW